MKQRMRKIVRALVVLCFITVLFVHASSNESTHADTKELDRIEVTKDPDKLVYESDDIFDPTGMEITAYYNDGTSAVVTGYSWDPIGSLGTNNTSIRINYTENSITKGVDFNITVHPALDWIEILTPPDKTVYEEGELFDPAGMVVQATYSDNTTEIITSYDIDFTGGLPTYGKTSLEMDITITYSYGYNTEYAYQPIKVNRLDSRKLTGLSIASPPDKLVYEEGDSLILNGLILTASYDNGKNVQISWLIKSVVEKPEDDLFATDNKFTISYTEDGVTKSVDQPITVNPWTRKLTNIEITEPPTKVSYKEGEIFETYGMKGIITYDDGYQDYLYFKRCSISPSGPLSINDTAVTITYTRGDGIVKTATQNITVSPASPLDRIDITTPPSKTEYEEGNQLVYLDMVVTAFYEDGTSRSVIGYAVNPETDLSLTDTFFTVSYTEGSITKTTTQPITVKGQVILTGITITSPPDKVEYIEGDVFDDYGMVVTATYSDGSTKVVKKANEFINVSPLYNLKVTDTFVTVTYTDSDSTVKTTTQPITVKAKVTLTGITITTPPDKVEYIEGDSFEDYGMVVTATYSDGSTKVVKTANEFKNVSPLYNLKVTDTFVTVTYTDSDGTVKTTTQPITVKAKVTLTGITITTPPDKVEYIEGDSFEDYGMVVTATYSDGSTKVVKTANEFKNVSPLYNLKVTDTFVTVTYTDSDGTVKTTTQPIMVKAKVTLTGITITTPPDKVEYIEGDSFDNYGMVVTATYSDGSTKVIKNADEFIEATPLKNLKVTDTYVTVSYSEGYTVKTATQPITVKVNSNNSGAGNSSGNNSSSNSGSGSSYVPVSTPTPTPEVPGTTTKEVKNADGSKTTTTRTLEESGKLTVTTIKESKNGDKSTTEVITDASGKMVSTSTETVSTDNKGTTTATTTTRKSDGSVTGTTVKTYESGKVVSTTTETKADKSVKTVNETKQADGSTTKTVTKVSAGGSAKMTVTAETPAADGQAAKKTEFVYSVTKNGEAKLVKVTTDEAEITIPATVTINDEKCKVVTIGKEAFKGNTSITKVVIGKYVETIGTKAFAGLKNLEEIYINGSKVNKVSEKAFYKISKNAKFYIKAKKSVCKSIADLIMGSGVKTVNYEKVK